MGSRELSGLDQTGIDAKHLSRVKRRRTFLLAHSDAATTERIPMMMAEESSPGRGALSEETIASIRLALQQYADDPDDGDRLRDALRLVSAEAREKSIYPEHLLTILKDMWQDVPNVPAASGADHVQLLQRVVTICIKEYYSL